MYRPRRTSHRCLRAKCVRGRKLIARDCAFAVRATSRTSAPAGNRASGGRSARIRSRSGSLILRRPSRPSPPRPSKSRRQHARFVSLGETGARPVALHFILPPNFRAAWAKERVMVCVEAEFEGRRLMLDALPRERAVRVRRFAIWPSSNLFQVLRPGCRRHEHAWRVRFSRALADFARTSAIEFRQGECRPGFIGNSPAGDHSSSSRRGIRGASHKPGEDEMFLCRRVECLAPARR